jgi:RHS repeat-associated protein
VTPSSGSATTYTDDGNGLLQSETTGATTTNFTWNVQTSLPLLLSDGANYYIYGNGTDPIEQIAVSGGATGYLLSDKLGSTRAVTNSSGTVTGSVTFDAWGNETGTSGSITTPFLFAGEYRDSASGFYYLRARWYDPTTGQFLSVDPMINDTAEPYAYAGNDPEGRTDPTGNRSEGYCAWLSFALAGDAAWGSFCMIEFNGNASIGLTATAGGGVVLSGQTIQRLARSSPSSLRNFLSISGGVAYEATDANSVSQLAGWFTSFGGEICIAQYCGVHNYFTNGGAIHGNLYGFGYGIGSRNDVALSGGRDYTWTWTLTGTAAYDVAGFITAFNVANPLHWLAGPLNLYT